VSRHGSAAASLLAGVVLAGMWCVAPALPATTAGAAMAVPACRATAHLVCVARAEGGRSVAVKLGQTVRVDLSGSGLRWSGLREVGPHVLRQEARAVFHAGTLTASYEATKAGRTALRASGAPKCATGEACPQFILLWQVRVVVRR
jgi:hypothetical protein